MLGELSRAVLVQSKFEVAAEAPGTGLAQADTADESIAVADCLPAEITDVLLSNNNSHLGLPHFFRAAAGGSCHL